MAVRYALSSGSMGMGREAGTEGEGAASNDHGEDISKHFDELREEKPSSLWKGRRGESTSRNPNKH